MLDQDTVIQKIRSLGELPSMKVFSASLRAMTDYQQDYREYLSTISKDPALTARVLAVANSAFYYSVEPVYTLKDAADRLGLVKLKSIVLGHTMSKIDTKSCPAFDKKLYWASAMLVAICASHIVDHQTYPAEDGNVMYCLGLLHNIGLLALATALPAELNDVLQNSRQALIDRERTTFSGVDHYIAGAELLRNWRLPELYAEVIQALSNVNDHDSNAEAVSVVNTAKCLVENDFQLAQRCISWDDNILHAIEAAYRKDQKWVLEFVEYL